MIEAGFGMRIDASEVQRLFRLAPETVGRRLRQIVEGGAIDVQRRMREKINVGATGDARRSIRYVLDLSGLKAEVGPTVSYGEELESGSRPHLVSVAEGTPLAKWARFRGINPYALQHSIAKKGTKPHPFVQPTFDEMKPMVLRQAAEGFARLAQELNDGRL